MKGGLRRVAVAAVLAMSGPGVAACNSFFSPQPPTPVPSPGPDIWHDGRWFTDSSGRVLFFHGVNMVEKQAPYYPSADGFGASDISLIASMGMNVVRLGVILAGVMPQPGQIDQSYLVQLESQVTQLAQSGIYVILDFHQDEYSDAIVPGADGFPLWATQTDGQPNNNVGFPANYLFNLAVNAAFDNFWADSPVSDGPGTAWGNGLQNYYQQALAAVAKAFASNTDVLGYEIMNEPWPGSVYPSCLAPTGCPSFDDGPFLRFIQGALSAIRSVDPSHLVFYEPNVLFNTGFPTNLGYVGDPGTVFAFHLYPICEANNDGNFPNQDQVCAPQEEQNFTNEATQELRSGAGEFLTEFGSADSTNDDAINRKVSEADAALTSWTFWSFDGTVVPNIGAAPTGTNVHQNVVTDLARPYPKAVAGIPMAWTFSTSTGVFSFLYMTRSASGAALPTGVTTNISTPAFVYPGGYTVSVTGATVISAPNASVLSLADAPGAAAVSVTVTPVGSPG